jgi:hypothetical protein
LARQEATKFASLAKMEAEIILPTEWSDRNAEREILRSHVDAPPGARLAS